MAVVSADVVCGELREFLSVQVLGDGGALQTDTPFADAGVDSFALMEAVLFVERRFGVAVPLERLTREHVRSVRTLGACVAELSAGSH